MTRMVAFIHARNARIARQRDLLERNASALQSVSEVRGEVAQLGANMDAGQGVEMSVSDFDVLLDKTLAELPDPQSASRRSASPAAQ